MFFKNKKIKELESEIDKLNTDLLDTKKRLLQTTQEKSELITSCINIINDAIKDPESRSEYLLKFEKYKPKEPEKPILKRVYILTIDEDDQDSFQNNYKDIAKDFDIDVECKFINEDSGDLKYKLVFSFLQEKSYAIEKFWDGVNNILEYEITYKWI